ncbi:MAG: SurA N-terminal domain-containing protein, partial [Gammaproteobacteria bacterium]|nr:SurA N-terminal domain-containing protein [Gammaproteobacteria bacterium]
MPIILAPVLIMLGAAAWAQGFHPGGAVRVNGVEISYQRFNGFYVEYRNSQGVAVGARGDQLELLKRLRQEAMDRLIEQELVRQAAAQQDIAVSAEEVDAEVAVLRAVFETPLSFASRLESEGFNEDSYRTHVAGMLAAKKYLDRLREGVAVVSDADLEQYYRDNEHRLTLPEQVRVRHILLTWKPLGTRDDRAAIRAQMTPILEQVRGGGDFV